MEAVGNEVSLRRVPLGFRRPTLDRTARVAMLNGFRDKGHLLYYRSMSVSCGLKEEEKRRKKMAKVLEKNLLALSELGLGVSGKGDVKGQIISEAADLLLAQLTKLRTEAKEMKRKRKQEKAARKSAAKLKNCAGESSSSSSESSDGECKSFIKRGSLKAVGNLVKPELKPDSTSEPITSALQTESVVEEAKSGIINTSGCCTSGTLSMEKGGDVGGSSCWTDGSSPPPVEKIEVCTGGKCRKSGAMELMAEFRRKVGVEGAVVGCKCMGKCRDGPNVRVVVNHESVEDGSAAARVSKGPLCVGVGLEDVGSTVSNLFGEKNRDVGFLAA